ncbi:MAG: hypothetical protein F4238_01745 [Gemmatimonadetes bacterium]|nr:hypothetical protein [Gemmatimonadota bacterium]
MQQKTIALSREAKASLDAAMHMYKRSGIDPQHTKSASAFVEWLLATAQSKLAFDVLHDSVYDLERTMPQVLHRKSRRDYEIGFSLTAAQIRRCEEQIEHHLRIMGQHKRLQDMLVGELLEGIEND